MATPQVVYRQMGRDLPPGMDFSKFGEPLVKPGTYASFAKTAGSMSGLTRRVGGLKTASPELNPSAGPGHVEKVVKSIKGFMTSGEKSKARLTQEQLDVIRSMDHQGCGL